MIESNEKKLKEVFGFLSKAKADVPSSSWNIINSLIKKPGFWSSSLYHFNYIYVLCGSLLISTGIIVPSAFKYPYKSQSCTFYHFESPNY